MKTVIINGCEYKLAYNLRSLFVYEEITGKPYTGTKTMDNYFLMFAMLQANNEGFELSFDDFIDACDEDFGLFEAFTEVVEAYGKRINAYQENKKKAATQ